MSTSYVGVGTVVIGSGTTVAMPAGIVEGDFLVFCEAHVFGYTPVLPGDWGFVGEFGSNVNLRSYIKFAGASEPDVTVSAGDNRIMRVHAFRGVPLFDVTTALPDPLVPGLSTILDGDGFYVNGGGTGTLTIPVASHTGTTPAIVGLPFIALWGSNTFMTIDTYSSTAEISSDSNLFTVGLFEIKVTLNVTWKDVSGVLGDESALFTQFVVGSREHIANAFWFISTPTVETTGWLVDIPG